MAGSGPKCGELEGVVPAFAHHCEALHTDRCLSLGFGTPKKEKIGVPKKLVAVTQGVMLIFFPFAVHRGGALPWEGGTRMSCNASLLEYMIVSFSTLFRAFFFSFLGGQFSNFWVSVSRGVLLDLVWNEGRKGCGEECEFHSVGIKR